MSNLSEALLRVGFWVPLGVCTYLTLVPSPPEHPVFALGDVVLHATAFAYLTVALVVLLGPAAGGRLRYGAAFAWMALYAVALEVAQSFVPERSAELKDLLVDLAGIGVGLALASQLAAPVRRFVSRVAGGA